MTNDNLPPIIARALAPFTPPDDPKSPPESDPFWNCVTLLTPAHAQLGDTKFHTAPSLVVDCPACYGGWRDTPTGVVLCGQCMGTGKRATNGGET